MKKYLIHILFISSLAAFTFTADASVASYTFSQSNGTYTPVTGGTVWGDTLNDDQSFDAIPLGFSYYFNGISYTSVSLNCNGFVVMGNTAVSNFFPMDQGTSNNIVCGLGYDIEEQFGSELMTLTTGTAGNHIFIAQWTNFREYEATPVLGDNYNFQIRLYEATGKAEVVYGTFIQNALPDSAQVGLRGNTNADFNNRTTTSNWLTTSAGTLNSATCYVLTAVLPANGLTFAWVPPAIDMGIVGLPNPGNSAGCFTSTETVKVRIENYALTSINFSLNPVVVHCSVAVTNPITFTNVTINNGTLAPLSTMDVTMSTTYNMSTVGNYAFSAYISTTGDTYYSNDTMPTLNVNGTPAVGTASAAIDTICGGTGITLTLTGSYGSIQWQSYNGITWVNELGAGSNSTTYIDTPAVDTKYRALVCSLISNIDSVAVIFVAPPTTTGDTRCGPGTVNLSAAGPGNLKWYTTTTGGTSLNTGTAYSPYVASTSTYYVGSSSGGGTANVGKTAYGGVDGTNNGGYLVFDAMIPFTLYSVVIYPYGTGAGTFSILLQNSAGTTLQTYVANVTGSTTAIPVTVPVNFNISPGTNYRLTYGTPTGGVTSMFRDLSGMVYPYTLPGVVSITTSSLGNGYYYFFYNWLVSSGCESARTPVVATVNPSVNIITTTTTPVICSAGQVSTIVASSANAGYSYTWSPTTGLNTSTNDTVYATPSVTTTYTIDAIDGALCHAVTTRTIQVSQSPVLTTTATPSTICAGNSSQLMTNPNAAYPSTIGAGTVTNINTAFPTPYGTYYWGARHQFILRASEILAAGFTAGRLDSIGFDVSALNGCGTLTNFEIKIGTTALNAITTFQTGLTSVFSSASYQPLVGWNMHTLSTPFVWDGVSNLIVETCFNNSASSFGTNASVRQTATAYNSTIHLSQDLAGVCSNNTVTTIWNQRPNIRLKRNSYYNYTWTPAITLTNAAIYNPVASPTVSTTYSLTVVDTFNTCSTIDSAVVTINTLFPVPAGTIIGPDSVCQGQANVSFSVPSITNAVGYSWSLPPGATITAGNNTNTISVTFSTSASSGNMSVFGTNACGIGTNSPLKLVTIKLLPFAAGTITGSDSVCKNTTGIVYSLPLISNATTYFWNVPSGASIITGSTTNTITVNYGATATSGNITGRGVNACGFGPLSTFPVQVFAMPAAAGTITGIDTVCQGESGIIFSVPTITNATSYIWSLPSGATVVSGDSTSSITVNFSASATSGILTVTGVSPCGNGTVSSNHTIVVIALTAPTITQHVDTLISSPSSYYQWNLNGSPIPGATGQTYLFPANGNYSVTITDANGCSSTSAVLNVLNFGINDKIYENTIQVFPNPFSGTTELSYTLGKNEHITIEIYNLLGEKINVVADEMQYAGKHTYSIKPIISDVLSGVLLLKVLSEEKVTTIRLVEIK